MLELGATTTTANETPIAKNANKGLDRKPDINRTLSQPEWFVLAACSLLAVFSLARARRAGAGARDGRRADGPRYIDSILPRLSVMIASDCDRVLSWHPRSMGLRSLLIVASTTA